MVVVVVDDDDDHYCNKNEGIGHDFHFDATKTVRMNPKIDRSSPLSPPAQGSIWEGEIQRIQPYGAFCSFGPVIGKESEAEDKYQRRRRRAWQGLVHISKLSATRVEKVEDVIGIDERVWVKVLEVERQDPDNFNHQNHINSKRMIQAQPRYRINLSMKDVSQDGTGLDLGRESEAKKQVANQLETNLNSMIGMGVARDPMDRLVLKSASRNGNNPSAKTVFRGGYTLVDDDEGEPESISSTVVPNTASSAYHKAPMGRGRGATLPAWMTKTEGPVGTPHDPQKLKGKREKSRPDDEIHGDLFRDHSRGDGHNRQRSPSRSEKKKDIKRRKKKRRHEHRRRHRDRDYSDDNCSDASYSGSSRSYDVEPRYRKRHKSHDHRRQEERVEHKNFSRRKKDQKKRKASRKKEKYERDDVGSHGKHRHYKSDKSSNDHGNSDSNSSSSFR